MSNQSGVADFATPASQGFRWPAEWEAHRATWLVWPHNRETWPGLLARAERAFCEMAGALADGERVEIVLRDSSEIERVSKLLEHQGLSAGALGFHALDTNDSWVRDTGPIFLTGSEGELAAADFRFDAWGGKYPPWDLDDALALEIAREAGARHFRADFVLEGGAVDGDGSGQLLTTESCLLESRREVGRSREKMEQRLRDWLMAESVIWLSGEVVGDDTDGHIDDLARFVSPGVVVAAVEADESDPNHPALRENWRRLARARDARGAALQVVRLPMPPPVVVDGQRCPASYINFYLANGRVLVPVFDAPTDRYALDVFRELWPERTVVPIEARALVVGLGSVHCLTQQEPRTAASA